MKIQHGGAPSEVLALFRPSSLLIVAIWKKKEWTNSNTEFNFIMFSKIGTEETCIKIGKNIDVYDTTIVCFSIFVSPIHSIS